MVSDGHGRQPYLDVLYKTSEITCATNEPFHFFGEVIPDHILYFMGMMIESGHLTPL